MKNLILVIFTAVLIVACGGCFGAGDSLQEIEQAGSLIELKPDSAWQILQNIDVDALNGEERAKHALLSVLALDRLGVQDSSFATLQPALDYYIAKGKGTPNDRLRAYYCRGIINYQRGEPEMAIRDMVDALSIKEATDTAVIGRAWIYCGLVYSKAFRFDEEVESYRAAADLYRKSANENKYRDCLMRIAEVYVNTHDDRAIAYRDNIADAFGADTISANRALAGLDLEIASAFGNDDEIKSAIDNYLNSGDIDDEGAMRVAVAFARIGEVQEAENWLNKISDELRKGNSAAYYKALIEAYNYAGDRDKLLDALIDFFSTIQDDIQYNATHGTNSAAEMREMELVNENRMLERDRIILVAIGCILMLVIIVITTYFRLRMKSVENERIKAYVASLEDERDNLSQILADKDEADVDPALKEIVRTRLAMLNKFLAAAISDKGNFDFEANKEVKNLVADREKFMDSTRLAFTASNPAFVRHLEEHGLTRWEVNYCCLYLLGLRGKEIGNYLGIRSQYNISSAIRGKLGIDGANANLGIYLRKLYGSIAG